MNKQREVIDAEQLHNIAAVSYDAQTQSQVQQQNVKLA